MAQPVYIPLLNPNETETLIASLDIQEGQFVRPGDVLATLETTKSTSELVAETAGYILGLRFQPGQPARAGEIFCYLAVSAEEQLPEPPKSTEVQPESTQLPPGVRITEPALALARRRGLDLNRLPVGPLVTEKRIVELAGAILSVSSPGFDPSALIIYGGGGHGKTLVELVRALKVYHLAGIVDDGLPAGSTILGEPVLGGGEVLDRLVQQGIRLAVNAVGGIGRLEIRLKIFERLAQAGFACPAVVHPRAFVEPSAHLGAGVQVFAQAYVGSEAQVGFGCIINTGAVISHDCLLGEYVNISPGAILAGAVQVGPRSLVGMGATLNLEVKVGEGARIGNGATVKTDVPAAGIVRAGCIWPQ
jgi:acetyltransferase EpsM